MDTYPIELPARRRRRRHSAEFKTAVIETCNQPGVSIAAVALANGLNANLLCKWVQRAERSEASESGNRPSPFHNPSSDPSPAFVPGRQEGSLHHRAQWAPVDARFLLELLFTLRT